MIIVCIYLPIFEPNRRSDCWIPSMERFGSMCVKFSLRVDGKGQGDGKVESGNHVSRAAPEQRPLINESWERAWLSHASWRLVRNAQFEDKLAFFASGGESRGESASWGWLVGDLCHPIYEL